MLYNGISRGSTWNQRGGLSECIAAYQAGLATHTSHRTFIVTVPVTVSSLPGSTAALRVIVGPLKQRPAAPVPVLARSKRLIETATPRNSRPPVRQPMAQVIPRAVLPYLLQAAPVTPQ